MMNKMYLYMIIYMSVRVEHSSEMDVCVWSTLPL